LAYYKKQSNKAIKHLNVEWKDIIYFKESGYFHDMFYIKDK